MYEESLYITETKRGRLSKIEALFFFYGTNRTQFDVLTVKIDGADIENVSKKFITTEPESALCFMRLQENANRALQQYLSFE